MIENNNGFDKIINCSMIAVGLITLAYPVSVFLSWF
jgi:hypothetical protein